MKDFRIKFYGTRGSMSVSDKSYQKYGGNTTCIRIFSDKIPENEALIIDAGSGLFPMGKELLADKKITKINMLFTHYHHDHIMGLFISPITFIKNLDLHLVGPLDRGIGPKEMLETMMKPPHFPVDSKEIRSHIEYTNVVYPKSSIILFHKIGGMTVMDIDLYEQCIKKYNFIEINKGRFPFQECLTIRMTIANHPDRTISYRFDDYENKSSIVILTDHENQDGISHTMRNHLKLADYLIIDGQYPRRKYELQCAGFGHGTPDYAIKLAQNCGIKNVGLTHHDPDSTDTDIDEILEEGIVYEATSRFDEPAVNLFACADYMEINLLK